MSDDAETTCVAIDFDHRDDESRNCPWPRWSQLRKEAPIGRTDRYGGVFILSRYQEVFEALRAPDTFSNAVVNIPAKPVPPLPPVSYDPPEHRGYREIVNPFFSPDKVAEYNPWIRETASRYTEQVLKQDSFDAATDVAMRVTSDVTLRFLGIPHAPAEFKGWVEELALQNTDGEQVARNIAGFLSDEVKRRRASSPGDDAIGALMTAKYDDERPLTHEEIVSAALLLTLAGFDTTTSAITGSIWYLVQNPDAQTTLMNADEKTWRLALDELVRWTSPIPVNGRILSKDAEFHGCPMRKGDLLMVLLGSANRDETQFENPDAVILDRFPNRHMGFGMGIHRCLGSHLAKAIMRATFDGLLKGLGDFRLKSPEDVVWVTAASQRGIRSLPLVRK